MKLIARLLREPLLHFLAIGGLIFLLFGPLLMVGAAYAQTGTWNWSVFLASIPVGLVTARVPCLLRTHCRPGLVSLAKAAGRRPIRSTG